MFSIYLKVFFIVAVVTALVVAAFNKAMRQSAIKHLAKYGWQILVIVSVLLIIYVYANQGT